MKPATIQAAYVRGYDDGNDRSGMLDRLSAWPSEADLANPDAITSSYLKGWSAGYANRNDGIPAWASDD